MKDLYAFSASESEAHDTYNLVSQCYDNVFQTLGIKYRKGKNCCDRGIKLMLEGGTLLPPVAYIWLFSSCAGLETEQLAVIEPRLRN